MPKCWLGAVCCAFINLRSPKTHFTVVIIIIDNNNLRDTPTNTLLSTTIPTLALLLAATLCKAQSTFVCPGEGNFADPDSCRRYIICESRGDTIKAYVQECPPGLVWNQPAQICVNDDDGTCETDA